MSVLPVSAELSSKDQVYNNPGVDKLNSLMQEMCGSYDQVIYLDVAHSVSMDGVLPEDAGIDGKHCNKKYCQKERVCQKIVETEAYDKKNNIFVCMLSGDLFACGMRRKWRRRGRYAGCALSG